MIEQHLHNIDNGKLYKAVNNSILVMWYNSRKEWGRCCTTYNDLFDVDKYLKETFVCIDDMGLIEELKQCT